MPNKYSHGLVFSHQQQWGFINPDPPLPLKSPSSANSRSQNRSAVSSMSSASDYGVISHYIHSEPDPEHEPSDAWRDPTHAARPSPNPTASDAPQSKSTSSGRSRPPSDRLRLESSRESLTKSPSSPPSRLEPGFTGRPIYENFPPRRSIPDSSSNERLRLVDSYYDDPRDPRPSLHQRSSSLETQIYAPENIVSPQPAREGQNVYSVESYEPYSSPSPEKDRQRVISTKSPEHSRSPVSTRNGQERFSPETRRANLQSPTRSRRQSFAQTTQALASPQPVQANYSFGTSHSPLSPSARGLNDHFSINTQSSPSTSAATGDGKENAHSPSLTTPQNGQIHTSLDRHRLQSPHQTQEPRRHPSLAINHYSSEAQSQTAQKPGRGRRRSIDSQTQRSSFDQSIGKTQHSPRQSINSKTPEDRLTRPFLSSQHLSLEQLLSVSEHNWEHLTDSQSYSSSSNARNSMSRHNPLADAQRYTPKNGQDRPMKPADPFTSHHKTLLPTGAYDNVLIETHGFPPERPPSPPATPDSDKSFSLTPPAVGSESTKSAPPIQPRSSSQSPSRRRPMLQQTGSWLADLPSESPRPKTSSAVDAPSHLTKVHSPTFSISTRRSSVNATRSPQSVSWSNFSETMSSPRRAPLNHTRDQGYFDAADLEPLPPETDYDVLPYENPNASPAIFRANQLHLDRPTSSPQSSGPINKPIVLRATQLGLPSPPERDSKTNSSRSRTSSVDSAAPPPIGLHRRTSTKKPHHHQHPLKPLPQLKSSKKDPVTTSTKPSLLSFFRPTPTPKSVSYSSIPHSGLPSLFPGYSGHFPPPPPQRMRPGLAPSLAPPRRSPAHMDAADKRKSWRPSLDDDVVDDDDGNSNNWNRKKKDSSRGASRLEKRKEFERILNAL